MTNPDGPDLVNLIVNPPHEITGGLIKKEEFTLYGTLLIYRLWEIRNKAKYAEEKPDLIKFLNCLKQDFYDHLNKIEIKVKHYFAQKYSYGEKTHKWQDGWIRINTDSAFSGNKSCFAGVAKDEEGITLSWFEKGRNTSATQAEAEAILVGVKIAKEKKWSRIQLLTNALRVVEAIAKPCNSSWEIKAIILDIVNGLNSFEDWECCWIPRDHNLEAHNLGQ